MSLLEKRKGNLIQKRKKMNKGWLRTSIDKACKEVSKWPEWKKELAKLQDNKYKVVSLTSGTTEVAYQGDEDE